MLISSSGNGNFLNENTATNYEMRSDLANLSSQGDKDRISVKEDIGHSYKKRLFFFQRNKNQIMLKQNPSKMSTNL